NQNDSGSKCLSNGSWRTGHVTVLPHENCIIGRIEPRRRFVSRHTFHTELQLSVTTTQHNILVSCSQSVDIDAPRRTVPTAAFKFGLKRAAGSLCAAASDRLSEAPC
ncbi:hypothetical protein KUCAC02_004800, partial [Chaenocephalus aceratus]